MTWANLISTGSGKLELRVEVEGWPYEFVTADAMEKSLSDGRERLGGMLRSGIKLTESVNIPSAEIDASSYSVNIVDHQDDDAITVALYSTPSAITYLDANADDSDTTLTVLSTASFPSSGVIYLGTEAIAYSGKTSTTFTGCTRAYRNTIAQYHYATGADAEELVRQEVTDWPRTIEGRRAYLYAYGDNDSLQGDGTLIWRGVVLTSPKLSQDHATWTFDVDPITRLFQQDLGAQDDEPVTISGIYYHDNLPLVIDAREYESASLTTSTIDIPSYLRGKYDSQQDFCEALNAQLNSFWSVFGSDTPFAHPEGNGWAISFTAPSGTSPQKYVWFYMYRKDPFGGMAEEIGGAVAGVLVNAVTNEAINWSDQEPGGTYKVLVRTGGGVPRAAVGAARFPNNIPFPGATGENPSNRVYVSGASDISGAESGSWDAGEDEVGFVVQSLVSADRSIRIAGARIDGIDGYYDRMNGEDTLPKIKFVSRLTSGFEGHLGDVRDYLVANSPELANLGEFPFLTSNDLADWTDTVLEAAAGGASFLTTRRYLLGVGKAFDEYIAEECKLLGVYPALDSDGKIRLRRVRVYSGSEPVVATIDADTVIVDNGLPTIELQAQDGYIGSVELKVGYDAAEDDSNGPTYRMRSVRSIAARKAPRKIEIAPFSTSPEDALLTPNQTVFVANKYIGLYGQEYAVVSVDVPFSLFGVLVGDAVKIVLPSLPALGARGLDAGGIVIGREWQLDNATGRLDVLVSYARVAGYTPTVRVASAGGGGMDWKLTTANTTPVGGVGLLPSGDDIEDHFRVGDRIYLREWDATSPTERIGTINAVDASGPTIDVTLDASWTGLGGNTYMLEYAEASEATATQAVYAYFASAAGLVGFSTSQDARVLA